MEQNRDREDIYMIDTNGIDLSNGIQESDLVDLDNIVWSTKRKLHKEHNLSIIRRFYLARNVVKAGVIAVALLVGGATITATTLALVKYVPNMGISQSDTIRVLQCPYTISKKIKAKNGKVEDYYFRVVGLSYDGKLLKMDIETNWSEVTSYDENGAETGWAWRDIYLEGNNTRIEGIEEGSSANDSATITQLYKEFEVDSLEGLSVVLDMDSDEIMKFVIPLEDLKLVGPKEAESIEQLGAVANDKNVNIVAIKSSGSEIENLDFMASKLPTGIQYEGIRDYVVKDNNGQVLKAINTNTHNGSFQYVMLGTERTAAKTVEVSSIHVSKEINQKVEIPLPKPGEKREVNQQIQLNDMAVVIKSISVKKELDDISGGYWVEAIYKVELPESSEYSIVEGTHISSVMSYKNLRQGGYSYKDGETIINTVIQAEEFEAGQMVTLELDRIKGIVLNGEWKMKLE